MTEAVPTLDLRRWESDRDAFVADLGDAYERYGFCGVSHHGIPDEIIQDAYATFGAFFALPRATKSGYHIEGSGGARGYTGFGVESAKDSDHPDLKEFWHVGRELPPGHVHADIMPPNLNVTEVPDFAKRSYRLFTALDNLGRTILQVMALHLGQELHFFDDKIHEGNSILRAIHYPPIEDPGTDSVRAGQHEDINLITLLIGSHEPGLEILSRQGAWIPVTTVEGAIVCNIGDMMQRLTNHVYPSTTHRVVNPPGEMAQHSRYSIPFFLHPNADFMIETLGSCVTDDRPNQYPEPLSSHAYLQKRLVEIGLLKESD